MVLKKAKSGVYHAHVKDESGKRRSITTKERDLAKARAVVKEAAVEKLERAATVTKLTNEVVMRVTGGEKITCAQALEKWEAYYRQDHDEHTIYTSKSRIIAWLEKRNLKSTKPYDIKWQDVDSYINMDCEGRKQNTLLASLTAIRRFMDYCCINGWAIGNPAKRVKIKMERLTHDQKENRPVDVFTQDEVKKILDNTEGFWRAATALAYYCGLRMSDICQLEWRSTATPGRLIVWTDKADVRLDVPLPTLVLNILTEMPVVHSRFMFPDEREINLSPTRRAVLSVNFKNLITRLGIEGKTFHGLRHTYAMKLKNASFTKEEIAKAMAHKSLESQETYTKH